MLNTPFVLLMVEEATTLPQLIVVLNWSFVWGACGQSARLPIGSVA
jgi:hypothetical protein